MKRTLRYSARVLRRSLPIYLLAVMLLFVGLATGEAVFNSVETYELVEGFAKIVVLSLPIYLAAIGVVSASTVESTTQ